MFERWFTRLSEISRPSGNISIWFLCVQVIMWTCASYNFFSAVQMTVNEHNTYVTIRLTKIATPQHALHSLIQYFVRISTNKKHATHWDVLHSRPCGDCRSDTKCLHLQPTQWLETSKKLDSSNIQFHRWILGSPLPTRGPLDVDCICGDLFG